MLLLPARSSFPAVDTVHHCDAITLLRAMPENSVDLIFTDPPYGHNNNNGDLIQRWELALGVSNVSKPARPILNDGAEANDLFQAFLIESRRVLKPGSCCCCCCGGGGPDPQFARWSIWMDQFIGFKMAVVWDKGPMGMGWHYRRSYEMVLVAQKPGATCKWYDTTQTVENVIRPGMGIPKIIPSKDDHPTPKPPSLAAHFIRLHTRPGELVVDPFVGGGSTVEAARTTGRRFIVGDIDLQWVTKSREKANKPLTVDMFAMQEQMTEPAAQQLSIFDNITQEA